MSAHSRTIFFFVGGLGMELSRRRLFVGSAATLLVGGFDPVTRLWTSVAQADCDDRDRRTSGTW
jgi:hypothetical protein